MADKIEMRLLVTEEQADAIRALFGHNEWELDEIPFGERERCQRMDPRPLKFNHLQSPLSQESRNVSIVLRPRVLLQSDTDRYGGKLSLILHGDSTIL